MLALKVDLKSLSLETPLLDPAEAIESLCQSLRTPGFGARRFFGFWGFPGTLTNSKETSGQKAAMPTSDQLVQYSYPPTPDSTSILNKATGFNWLTCQNRFLPGWRELSNLGESSLLKTENPQSTTQSPPLSPKRDELFFQLLLLSWEGFQSIVFLKRAWKVLHKICSKPSKSQSNLPRPAAIPFQVPRPSGATSWRKVHPSKPHRGLDLCLPKKTR